MVPCVAVSVTRKAAGPESKRQVLQRVAKISNYKVEEPERHGREIKLIPLRARSGCGRLAIRAERSEQSRLY